jgi:hypothetical protein
MYLEQGAALSPDMLDAVRDAGRDVHVGAGDHSTPADRGTARHNPDVVVGNRMRPAGGGGARLVRDQGIDAVRGAPQFQRAYTRASGDGPPGPAVDRVRP